MPKNSNNSHVLDDDNVTSANTVFSTWRCLAHDSQNIRARSANKPPIASVGFRSSRVNNGSAVAAASAAPAIIPVLNRDINVLADCAYSFFISAGINAWIMPILAPPAKAVHISPVSDVLKPRNKQAKSRMESPTVIPLTAPVLAKSHGPLSATNPIMTTGKVVSRLNSVADSPASRCKTGNNGPMEARMGRRFNPIKKAINANIKGEDAMRFKT